VAEAFQPSNTYYLHAINLAPKEGELFQRFHKDSVQRRIRRAERAGLTYESGRSEALMEKFYRLLILTRRRHRVPPQPRVWFSNLLACMGEALEIHVACHQGRAVAAVITLRLKNRAVYKYGGSDQTFHCLGSVPFILWKAIQKAQSAGAQSFDLGRSDYLNAGGVIFKDHWASTRTVLTYRRFPMAAQDLVVEEGPASHLAHSLFGLLPNSMLKLTGELMYRHIG
jgi:lipid II:glycine glycyltransferase (peptidoglycan interpeptide bridge formation enzyme)